MAYSGNAIFLESHQQYWFHTAESFIWAVVVVVTTTFYFTEIHKGSIQNQQYNTTTKKVAINEWDV